MGEEGAAAAQPRLHLVQHEEDARLPAPLPHPAQVVGRRHHHAVLALHRLQQHGGGALAGGAADGLHVAEGHPHEAGGKRLEGGAVALYPAGGHRGQGAPVEGAVGHDDLVGAVAVVAAPAPGQLDGRLHRLRPRVAEEGAVHPRRPAEEFGQLHLGHRVEQVGDVHQGAALFGEGLHHHRVAMAQADGGDARHQVQVATAAVVPDVAPLAPHQHHRLAPEEGEHELGLQGPPVLHGGAAPSLLDDGAHGLPVHRRQQGAGPASVGDEGGDARRPRPQAGLHLGHHPPGDDPRIHQPGRLHGRQPLPHPPVAVHDAGDIGQQHQQAGGEGRRHRPGGQVGVDVQQATGGGLPPLDGDGRQHRHPPLLEEREQEGGVHLRHFAHQPQLRLEDAGAQDGAVGPRQAQGRHPPPLQGGHQLLVHQARQHRRHHLQRLGVGDALPAVKADGGAQARQPGGDEGAAAVDHHRPQAPAPEGGQVVQGGVVLAQGGAADLDHQRVHGPPPRWCRGC